MFRILLLEFFGDLRSQRMRVFLTTFAVAWGTIAVVLLLSFGEGLRNTMILGLLNAGDRIFMISGQRTTMEYEGLSRGRQIRLAIADLDLLRRGVPDLELLSPSYGRWANSVRVGEARSNAYMEGVYPTFREMRRMYPAADGRFLNERDLAEKRRVAFIGNELADRLFNGQPAVGGTIRVDGLPFAVVGVMRPKMQTAFNNGPDSERIVIPASTFETIYGARYVSQILARPRDITKAEATKEEIYRVLGRRHKFDPEDSAALGIWDFIESEREVSLVFRGIQIFLGVVGGFTLLIAGVGVANIMYVVVRERTREIGIKLAIGARRSHIIAQFLFEALLLALTGGLIGLLISATVVFGVNTFLPKEGVAEFLANPELSGPVALTTVASLAVIGLLAGFFPARRAAAVDPVESLRYE